MSIPIYGIILDMTVEVEKFRIRNFKSVIDSGDCYLGKKFTILAGKNESGKTTILEALHIFDENQKFIKCNPVSDKNAISSVEMTFILDKDDVESLLEECDIECKLRNSKTKITLRKCSNDNKYQVISIDGLELATNEMLAKKFNENFSKQLKKITSKNLPDYDMSSGALTNIKTALTTFAQQPSLEGGEIDAIKEALSLLEEYEKGLNQTERVAERFIQNYMPYYILFSSFNDSFPDSIPLAKLKNNEWAQDLEKISNFRIDELLSEDPQEIETKIEETNLDFSKQFKNYWKQDEIKLKISLIGDSLHFWIEENNIPYKPSQRSKGQQWYLNFYVKVLARIKEDAPNIILIDEPGLYLHAKAQKDVLNVLSNDEFSSQIIFSTHSPYLIEEKMLDDVRLIEKTNGQTRIIGKIWAQVEDGETLTPILTSIGMGVNDSIMDRNRLNNVVVEGMEDVFYLRGLCNICNIQDINFICGGGSSNMGRIGAILEGWGCDVRYLFDNDDGKKAGLEKLDKWGVLDGKIRVTPVIDGGSTVDLIAISDFKKYVLDNGKEDVSSNSDYIKKHKKFEKVLGARKFLNATKDAKNTFSEETISNAKGFLNSLFSKE